MESSHVKSFNYFDMSALSNLKGKADEKKDETLKVVAQQLESVFLELVLKTMHDANAAFKSEMFDSEQEDFYQDLFNQQLALSLSKEGGVGLADMIYQQLKPKEPGSLPIMQQRIVRNTQEVAHEDTIPFKQVAPVTQETVALAQEEETSINSPQLSNLKEFVETLLPHAKVAAKLINIDPHLLLAQSALETGWGKHIMQHDNGESSHNLFGVKSHEKWEGKTILSQTLEFADNQAQKIKASFKSYDSYLESFLDYINLLQNKRYEKALENTQDPKKFVAELHQAGYATDPQYAEKILAIYEKFAAQ